MAMRRSRIKLTPNLGAKARAPQRSSTAGAGDVKIKQESSEKEAHKATTVIKLENAVKATPIPPNAESTVTTSTEPNTKKESDGKESADASAQSADVPVVPAPEPTILTTGDIIPLELIKAANKITAVAENEDNVDSGRDEPKETDQDKKDSVKSTPGHRVRNWFPKAKPNLAEAGRARMRHNSFSGDEDVRSPPAASRVTSRVRQASVSETVPSETPASVKEEAVKEKPPVSTPREVVKEERPKPNINNSLGIDLGSATRKPKVEKDEDNKRKVRKVERLDAPVDRSKVTMRDLIYMNPVKNPMSNANAGKDKRRQSLDQRSGKSESEDEPKSVAGDVSKDVIEVTKEEPDLTIVPQVKIGVNGEIIINESSLLLENKDPDADAKAASMELIHESDLPALPFAYGHKTPNRLWSEMETKKFYLALSAVGTDFSLMVKLFPKRNRTELKRKFKREEKFNRYLVDKAIRERQHFDQEFFDDLAALEIEEPKPKRQRKRKDTTTTDEEDQENQGGKAEKKTKKGPKSKEGKEAEGGGEAKPAPKKRGKRKPKEDKKKEAENGEGATEESEKPQKPERKKRPNKLTYQGSDSEAEHADQEQEKQDADSEDKVVKKKRRKKKAQKSAAFIEGDSEDAAEIRESEGDQADTNVGEANEEGPAASKSKTQGISAATKKGKGKNKIKKPSPAEEGEAEMNGDEPDSEQPTTSKRKRGRPPKEKTVSANQEDCSDSDKASTPKESTTPKKPRKRSKRSVDEEPLDISVPDAGSPLTPDVHSTNPLKLSTAESGEDMDPEQDLSINAASVSVMSPNGIIQSGGNTTSLQQGSYLFVASTPPGEEDGEPIIHVYIVSQNEEGEEDGAAVMTTTHHHPTPSPMGSPSAERTELHGSSSSKEEMPQLETDVDPSHSEVVPAKGDTIQVTEGGLDVGPSGSDIVQTEFVYTENVEVPDEPEVLENDTNVECITEVKDNDSKNERTLEEIPETDSPPGENETVKDQIPMDNIQSEIDNTTSNNVNSSEEILQECKSPSCPVKDTGVSPNLAINALLHLDSSEEAMSPLNRSLIAKKPTLQENEVSQSQVTISEPSKVEEPSINSVNNGEAEQMSEPANTAVNEVKSEVKPSQAKAGRRRRINAMPNIGSQRKPRPSPNTRPAPGGSTRPAPRGTAAQAGAAPKNNQVAAPEVGSTVRAADSPPIDEVTASDILVEMSMSEGED